MSQIEIIPVTDAATMRHFIRVPWTIYRHDPFWVPPLLAEMKKLFDRSRHPFFKHSRADFFLARRSGKYVGRIAAILNNNHNRFHNEKTAFFGFFECIDDREIAAALLDKAAQWARIQGMTELRGPANYSTNETVGLLIEGFDSSPYVMMPYNPRYYADLIEGAGFQKAMDLYAWWLKMESGLGPKIARVGRKVLAEANIQVRSIQMDCFWQEVEIIKRIYNDAWSNNWGFVPMTEEEFDYLAKELKLIVDPRIVLIAEKNGEPVAFSLALPDFNQALKKVNGRLFPFGLLRLIYFSRRIRQARVMALGVARKVQNWSGVGAALYYESFHRGLEAGYECGEFSWILENNYLMNRSLRHLGARLYKRYRIYRRLI